MEAYSIQVYRLSRSFDAIHGAAVLFTPFPGLTHSTAHLSWGSTHVSHLSLDSYTHLLLYLTPHVLEGFWACLPGPDSCFVHISRPHLLGQKSFLKNSTYTRVYTVLMQIEFYPKLQLPGQIWVSCLMEMEIFCNFWRMLAIAIATVTCCLILDDWLHNFHICLIITRYFKATKLLFA